jgi:hypothetical protein
MSVKPSKTSTKASQKFSRLESDDAEERQEESTAYDRLPALMSTFPVVFKALEEEQR